MGVSHVLLVAAYMALVSAGHRVLSSILFPIATGLAEHGGVAFVQRRYHRLITTRREAKDFSVQGDQLELAVVVMVLCAHALAEGSRLAAIFAGAVLTHSYAWVGAATATFALNVFVRLGWLRFSFFCALRTLAGVKAAVMVAPTSWNVLHDELKVYGGYFRFIPLLGLVVARATRYSVPSLDAPGSPAFTTSATLALLCTLCLELLEDAVVLWELLPMAPVPTELLQRDMTRSNGDPAKLLALECRAASAVQGDPWRSFEVGRSAQGRRCSLTADPVTKMPGICLDEPEPELMERRVALGPRDHTRWGRLRAWLGHPRTVVPTLTLHGLRELPFVYQFGTVGVMVEFTNGLLSALIGAAYLRGLREMPCEGLGSFGMFWWDVPLSC